MTVLLIQRSVFKNKRINFYHLIVIMQDTERERERERELTNERTNEFFIKEREGETHRERRSIQDN